MGREELDLTQGDRIRDTVRAVCPELIVNAAAYTAVDQAERQRELAEAVNSVAPGILAEEAARVGAMLVHYSTDYVFDGSKGAPYVEQDTPNPLNFYGQTKLTGEKAVQAATGSYLILRTSWVYSFRRPCFVTKVLRWAREHRVIRIVIDQVSNPTWARSLAVSTAHILSQGLDNLQDFGEANAGLYHLAARGAASRYEWAMAILAAVQGTGSPGRIQLIPARSTDFDSLARRPRFSALDCSALGRKFSVELPDWKVALGLAFNEGSEALADHLGEIMPVQGQDPSGDG